MKKILLSLWLLSSVAFSEVTNMEVTKEFIEANKIKIIDIRTEQEWIMMGVLPSAYLLTFFDEDQEYSPKMFLKELDKIVKKDEQFAIISNSASRTKLVSNFLGKKHDYKVINLTGGMVKLIKDGYSVKVYDPSKIYPIVEELKASEEDNSTKE
ncbi:MAG TPA: rhodanese-like domain-containing protein [Campylobacterales bacterium]|nr:rhodanese-like domain-containing protein [Campylobacterales bacterium]HHS92315.1 rhodanese-like domain-containing protein [Campylobacterales bacterium]